MSLVEFAHTIVLSVLGTVARVPGPAGKIPGGNCSLKPMSSIRH